MNHFLTSELTKSAVAVLKAIENCSSFLITSHINLDGDAVGSELAFKRVIEKMGKRATIVNAEPLPYNLKFLPAVGEIHLYPEGLSEKWDAAIVLDIGKWHRVGRLKERLSPTDDFIINIDHHISNDGFGAVSIVADKVSSTAELIYELFKLGNFEIDYQTALYLYVGILTDTGQFAYNNTYPSTHRIAAELLSFGLDTYQLVSEIYKKRPLHQIALYKIALASLQLSKLGRIAWITLRDADFKNTGAAPDDSQGFIETPREIEGVEVAVYFRETPDGKVRVSMRSNSELDLNEFASRFGGGGHKSAAGITLHNTSLAEAQQLLIPAIEKALK